MLKRCYNSKNLRLNTGSNHNTNRLKKEVIYGVCPSKSNSYKIIKINNKYTIGKSQAVRSYEQSFYLQCRVYKNANIEGYLEFYMDVYYPNERSDLDNSTKLILDCCQKIQAFKNDNKVVKVVLRKFIDKKNPRVEFIIKKVD